MAELKPGPAPTGRDKLFDALYGAFGGTPDKRWAADKLATALDWGTLGMLTGAYDGGRDLATTGNASTLAMALMPGAKVPGAAAKAGRMALTTGRHQIDDAGSRLTYKVGEDGTVHLDSVYSSPEARGKGQAKSLVNELVQAVDAEGRPMSLEVAPGAPGVEAARLRKWYEGLGFTGPDYWMTRGGR